MKPPPAPPADAPVLEIRVHGVAFTPADAVLGVPADKVEQVAGDDTTGFFRAEGADPDADHVVEAYSWGSLTSRAAGPLGWMRRAAWLVLLPFALANVAYWSRPGLSDPGDRARVATAIATRSAGVLLTVLFITTSCIVGIDLYAWQCFSGGGLVCPQLPDPLQLLARDPFNTAPHRVVVGTLVPLLTLLLLWILSRRTMEQYEEVSDERPGAVEDGFGPAGQPVLRRPRMWRGARRLRRLQLVHMAAGLACIVGFGAIPFTRESHHLGWPAWFFVVAATVLGLLAVATAGVTFWDGVDFRGSDSVRWRAAWRARAPRALLIVGLLLLGAHLAFLWLADARPMGPDGQVTQWESLLALLFVVLAGFISWLLLASRSLVAASALLGLLAAAVLLAGTIDPEADGVWRRVLIPAAVVCVGGLVLHRRSRVQQQAWGGCAPAVLLSAAVAVAALFTTAAVVAAGDYLNGGDQSATDLVESPVTQDTAAAALRTIVDSPDAPHHIVAGGPAQLSHGVIQQRSGGRWTITGGTVKTTMASLLVEPEPGLGLALPATTVGVELGSLSGLGGSISLKDVYVVPSECSGCDRTVEDGQLHVGDAAAIAAPGISLTVGAAPQAILVVPSVLIWLSLALLGWVISTGIIATIAFARLRRHASEPIKRQVAADRIGHHYRAASRSARFSAAYPHRAERLAGFIAAATALIGLIAVLSGLKMVPPSSRLVDLGLLVAIGLSFGLVFVAARIRGSARFRRSVGIVWDLTTFWPRLAHPLAPPCYSERVVPEVRRRVDWALGPGGFSRVVLSGHSQGSAITAAASMRLSDEELRAVLLVTYGSQLRAWYGRVFPDVLGPVPLGHVPMPAAARFDESDPDAPDTGTAQSPVTWTPATGSLAERFDVVPHSEPRWINLFRRSDPLGMRVFSSEQSIVDRYVREVPANDSGDSSPPVQTHSDYQFTPEYDSVLRAWRVIR